MVSTDGLRALIADHESDRVERTASTTNTDKFGDAICAFANDFPNHRPPGYLVVGVEDDGTVGGRTVTDALLRNLGALRSNVNIEPARGRSGRRRSPAVGSAAGALQGKSLDSRRSFPSRRYLPSAVDREILRR